MHGPRHRLLLSCLALLALWFSPPVHPETYRYENVGRIVAFGDVHGAYDELASILQGTGLVDENLSWIGGETHLVSVGDLLDRGDYGRQVLDLLMRLEGEAAAAGGAVHVLLGNHEVMTVTGDLRYVSEGDYAQFGDEASDGLPAGFAERLALFAPEGEYGQWLLERPVMIAINDFLFLHGGLSDGLASGSLEDINASARRDLRRFAEGWHALLQAGQLRDADDFDVIRERARELAGSTVDESLREAAAGMVESLDGLPFDPNGPLWYRGTSLCHPYMETRIAADVLEHFGASHAVVGHTPTGDRRITSRMDGRIYRIDTGINNDAYKGRPSALLIEGGSVSAWYEGERFNVISAGPIREWPRPYGMSDAEIEEFLLNAEVTESEDIGIGITQSRRLTLERDGRRMRAVFKTIDTNPRLERGRWSRGADSADRYKHEIAAYRLDRLLELDMVPVTVEREIDGKKGSLQYWIEDAFNENQRREQQIPFTGYCGLQPQYDLMNAFDVLIFNVDRNLSDILYDRDWMLWLIDHSRSFSTQRGVPDMIRRTEINVSPELAAVLERVNHENLKEFESWLHRRQIDALVSRAQVLRRRR